jgi:hypothetical protein
LKETSETTRRHAIAAARPQPEARRGVRHGITQPKRAEGERIMSHEKGRGLFVWYDLMTTDPQAAKQFYAAVAGWDTHTMDMPEGPYEMWTRGSAETALGGVNPLPEGAPAPPHWLAYVAVPDVDATAARAAELGGQVLHAPSDIPQVGRFAVLQDPQGGVIAVYRSATGEPAEICEPEVGQFSWHELATTDLDGAFAFYADLFAWERQEAMDMGPAGTYQIYGQGDVPYGGMFVKPPEMPAVAWLYYVRVADMEAAVEKVKAGGGQVINGPMEVPGGDSIAQCLDPQGAMFAVHFRKA